MNINALLSPSDSANRDSSSSSDNSSPRKARQAGPGGSKRATSGLSQEVSRSPETITSNPSSRPTSSHDSPTRASQQPFALPPIALAAAPNFRPLQQSPTSHPSSAQESPTHYGQWQQSYQRPIVAHRPSSTPHMETLADLASMQQQPPVTRAYSANSVRQIDVAQTPRSPSLINPTSTSRPPIFQNNSGQSLADLTMAEAPAQTPPPREVESNALSHAESKTITDLLNYLNENSYAYTSHVELINLLHKDFIAHACPPTENGKQEQPDPRSYALLTELRQAREAMDTRFAVGEDIWEDWLSDEILLAVSIEERIAVTELFQKAVQDEPASVKLWQMYAGWVWINYAACTGQIEAGQAKLSEEDKELAKDLFTRDMVITVLEQAMQATQWRVDESHVLWNRYAELAQEDFPASPTPQDIERLRSMFVQRLQIPHVVWDETVQKFWPIVSKYEGSNWEPIMAEVRELAVPAKTQMGLREAYEFGLRKAMESGDRDAIFHEFTRYLQWEKKNERKQRKNTAFEYELRCALYERALLRFPTYTEWWLDYIDSVTASGSSTSVLPLIERATRHCPWSGDLWSRRILQSDVEGKPHQDIEAVKHRATNSGLLDVGGMEEMVKVLQQWCSYLRRHAFSAVSTEDDLDTAEVGITMAIEDINEAGKKVYGKEFQGDPLYRLETIHIKFLGEARRLQDARNIYKELAKIHKNSQEFWAKYYQWELMLWGFDRMNEAHRVETSGNGPHRATAVLQEALSQRNLDWPEKILELYLNHFQQHESRDKLQRALIDAREFSKHLAIRRANEAAEAESKQPAYQGGEVREAHEYEAFAGEKRKREEEEFPNGDNGKKPKMENGHVAPETSTEPSASASAQIKRDRENNTITLRNLPAAVQELDIKKFFRDIGTPLSINILKDKSGDSTKATVEFEAPEDVLAAKTRDGRELNGNEVRIQSGTQTTLYVANYPPEYDETAIRNLFDSYGDIVSVRFPSLKFNNRRRFCYVSFLTSEMAKAAEAAMDDKMLDGTHKLLAKISDPDAKKQRSGAQAEGRELFVKNIDRSTPDREIKAFFENYGAVLSMNMLKLVNGQRTGNAFIVFSSAEEATAALEANNKPFHDRILHVELSSTKGRAAPYDRARKEDMIVKSIPPASPDPEVGSTRRGSDVSMQSTSAAQAGDDSWKTAKERKIAILNLPDTVNDARVRAAMEAYGPLVKIQMRRRDNGAIVEFANVQDAFNVSQGVDCSALGPDVRTGDVSDLLARVKKRQDTAADASVDGGASSETEDGEKKAMQPPPRIVRPAQRGGRRGGLGFKRGGASGGGKSDESESAPVASSAKKTNADFRNMFAKGKEDQTEKE